LILAFFLLAVVPLTAVTLYSYQSSARALRDVAEAEGKAAAREMGRRMELVTAEVSEQIDRLWDHPNEAPASTEQVALRSAARVAEVLGTTAALLDRVEFVPGPPTPPVPLAAPEPPEPAAEPTPSRAALPPDAPADVAPAAAPAVREAPAVAPVPPVAPAPPVPAPRSGRRVAAGAASPEALIEAERALRELQREADQLRDHARQARLQAEVKEKKADKAERIVIDIAGALREASRALQSSGDVPPAWVALMTEGIAQAAQAGVRLSADGLRYGAREVDAALAEKRAVMRHKWITPGGLGMSIQREGKVVGTVNATFNKERVLGAVFGLARSDQGEVPFALDESGHLFTPRKAQMEALQALDVAAVTGDPGTTQVDSRDNWLVVKRRDPSGMTFGIARPLGESLQALQRTTMHNLLLGLLVIGIAAAGIVPISGRMTRDLSRLADTAGQIAHGNFGVRVPVRSDDEIGRLSAAFNRMAEGVEAHQRLVVEQERLQRELELCRRIQNEMLPHGALDLGCAEVKGVSIPAREVGGDFFNYFALDDGQVAMLVGDVSGKGVGAALLMANVQATLRARLPLEQDLATLVDAIDRDVDERTPGGVYVTLFIGILDSRTRRLRYVNAGHHPQFILRTRGGLERMPSAGLPVGLFAGHGYREQQVMLDPGDLLFFYTDGTIETENEAGEMFGFERLEALLEAHHDGALDNVLSRVESTLRGFRGNAEPFDDATMMALRVAGA
jgi:serine phosphatase RsbU (regulator of sigma subunit)